MAARRVWLTLLTVLCLATVGAPGLLTPAQATGTITTTTDKKIDGKDSFTGALGATVTVSIKVTAKSYDYIKQDLTVTDALPDCMQYVPGTASPAPVSAPASGPGGSVSWTFPQVTSGGVRTVAFKATLVKSGTCTNKATTISDKAKPSTDTVTVTVPGKPDLALDKDCTPDAVAPGAAVSCALSYVNRGTSSASSVKITDVMDAGLTYVAGSTTGAAEPTVQANTPTTGKTTLTWSVGSVAAGKGGTILFQQRVPATGPAGQTVQYADTAKVVVTGDPNPDNNTDTEITTVTYPQVTKTVDVYVVKTAPATALPGQTVTHSLAFGNAGTDTAQGVSIKDTLTGNQSFVPGSVVAELGGSPITVSTTFNATQPIQQVTFGLPALAKGAAGTITYKVKIDPTASTSGLKTLTDTGLITTTSTNTTNPDNDSSTATTKVDYQPKLTLTKSGCRATVVSGGLQTYTLGYKNSGTAPATSAVLTDTPPANQPIAAAPQAQVEGNTATWTLGNLAVGASGTRQLTVVVNAANNTSVTNVASITATNHPKVEAMFSTPVTNAGAATSGSAYELKASVNLLGSDIVVVTPQVTSASSAPTRTADDAEGPVINLALPGVLTGGLLSSSSRSAVDPGQASTTSTSRISGLSLFGGALTATTVQGVTQSTADPFSASSSFAGTTFQDLVINGTKVADVAPNTPVTITNALGVVLAKGLLNEQTRSASLLPDGRYTTSASLNLVRLTLTAAVGGGVVAGTEVIIGHSESTATYPSGRACGAAPSTVEARAFTAFTSSLTLLGLDSLYVSKAEITPLGGSESANVAANVPGLAVSDTANNTAEGAIGSPATSKARSQTEGLNLLGGLVTADVVDVTSASTANGTNASSTLGATFLDLRVGGQGFDLPVPPNTTLAIPQPGGDLALVILNEQITNSDGTKNTEGTVNAVRIRLLSSTGVLTTEVIAVSAHSAAHVG